jgi:hypothetical protein
MVLSARLSEELSSADEPKARKRSATAGERRLIRMAGYYVNVEEKVSSIQKTEAVVAVLFVRNGGCAPN